MIRITVELLPMGSEEGKRTLGTLEVSNDGTGTPGTGNYRGVLVGEYTTGRKGRVTNFDRRRQSVWSLVGAFLKLYGHTGHSPKDLHKD